VLRPLGHRLLPNLANLEFTCYLCPNQAKHIKVRDAIKAAE